MRQLTLEQKLEAYKWVRKNFMKLPFSPFVCCALLRWVHKSDENGVIVPREPLNVLFPEFYSRKPKGIPKGQGRWFNEDEASNQKREALLDECIKECEEKLSESIGVGQKGVED